MILRIFLLLAVVATRALADDDYYDVLGVAKDADDRTIRKAFKKLAMTHHPDKNKEDEHAHDKFVKINRAYEVLKDGELRKKYDLHGEEGLKEGMQGNGQQYQSWQFYKDNFGIYDNDEEVVTLSASDFEQLVLGSTDTWFINFYSTHCSHCHELAPAWRQMAIQLDGVLRVGAVNCADEWMFCRERQIFGYPSLVTFPNNGVYQGARTTEALVDFALGVVKPTVHDVQTQNLLALSTEWEPYNGRPWVIEIGDGQMSHTNRRKLSAMLDGLVNVGSIDCHKEEALCDKLGGDAGVFYYPTGKIDAEHGEEIASLDPKEIAALTLNRLPDLDELAADALEEASLDQEGYLLVHFVGSAPTPTENIDLKKLPALVGDLVKLGRLNCREHSGVCAEYHIKKLPAFAVFKPTGGFELHYGKSSKAMDIAAFVRAAYGSNLRALSPDVYDELIGQSDGSIVWVVDFFAPWCPPCQKLLPEMRKAARQTLSDDGLRWATVDCTVHTTLCQRANVHSYPTTIVYNASTPNTFVGLHTASQLVEFVDEVRHPLVVTLDDRTFDDFLSNRPDGQIVVADFFAPWCGHCMELAPQWRKLAKMMQGVSVVSVDCTQAVDVCRRQGIQGYPTIRLFFADRPGFEDYRNWMRDASHLRQWVAQYMPSNVKVITSHAQFVDILDGESPYLVDFFTPWCGHCTQFAPEFELVAEMLGEHGVTAVKVNCDATPTVCQLAGIRAYPTVRIYTGASEGGTSQPPRGVDIQSQQAASITDTVVDMIRRSGGRPRDEL